MTLLLSRLAGKRAKETILSYANSGIKKKRKSKALALTKSWARNLVFSKKSVGRPFLEFQSGFKSFAGKA